MTDGEGGQEEVFPVVVNLAEERDQVVTLFNTGGTLGAGSGVGEHVIVVLQGEHLGVSGEVLYALAVEFDTGQGVEGVVAELHVVIGGIGPGPLEVVGLTHGGGRGVVVHHVGVPGVGDGVDVTVIVVQTEVGTQGQALDGGDVHKCVAEDAPYLEGVVAVVIQFAERILTVAHAADGTGEGNAVFLIDRKGGGHLQGVLHGGAVHLGGVGDGEVLADGQPFEHFQAGVDTGGNVLEVRIFQDTLVVLVSHGNQHGGTVGHVGNGEVVALEETGAGDGLEPVGVAEAHGLLAVHVAVVQAVDGIGLHLVRGGVIGLDGLAGGSLEVQAVVGGVLDGIQSVVEGGLGHGGGIFGTVGQRHHALAVVHLGGEVGGEVNAHFVALLTFAGGNHDNAVGGAAAVDGGRCGVLQDLHGLDIVRVQGVEAAGGRYTINNIKRVLRRVEGADTADADRTLSARGTVAGDGHAGNAALQGTHGVCTASGFHLVGLDDGDGTGQVGFTLGLVTRDHYLGKFGHVFVDDHIELRGGGNLHGAIADTTDFQDFSCFNFEGEITVEVCHAAVRRSLFHDCGANHAVAVGR